MWWNCCMEMLKMWKFQFAFFQKSYENVLHFRLLLTRVNESKRSVNSVQTFNVLIPFLLIEARCGHLSPFYKFSVSYFCCCNFIRHSPWHFLTYGEVFTAVGNFLLKLLSTEYFTHLPRSSWMVKNDLRVIRRLCFLKKLVRSFHGVSFVTMNAVMPQWSSNDWFSSENQSY